MHLLRGSSMDETAKNWMPRNRMLGLLHAVRRNITQYNMTNCYEIEYNSCIVFLILVEWNQSSSSKRVPQGCSWHGNTDQDVRCRAAMKPRTILIFLITKWFKYWHDILSFYSCLYKSPAQSNPKIIIKIISVNIKINTLMILSFDWTVLDSWGNTLLDRYLLQP